MNTDMLVDQAIASCPYLLAIQIRRDETLKVDTEKWIKQIIETADKNEPK